MIPYLPAALAAAAPRAEPEIWLPLLDTALPPAGINTPRVVAAFLGQCAVEAGVGFTELVENTNYTTAQRLYETFPSRFRSQAEAASYIGSPRRIANRVYAWKNGNGDEESDDGWEFRGSGLLQLTGRDNIGRFALASGRSIDAHQAALWLRTPEGAVAGAVWYWTTHSLNELAERWDIDGITLRINGPAMMRAADRRERSLAAIDAIFTATDTAGPGATIKPNLMVPPLPPRSPPPVAAPAPIPVHVVGDSAAGNDGRAYPACPRQRGIEPLQRLNRACARTRDLGPIASPRREPDRSARA